MIPGARLALGNGLLMGSSREFQQLFMRAEESEMKELRCPHQIWVASISHVDFVPSTETSCQRFVIITTMYS